MMQPQIQPEDHEFHFGGSITERQNTTQKLVASRFLTTDHWPLTTLFQVTPMTPQHAG
jgi:hypothetical protein